MSNNTTSAATNNNNNSNEQIQFDNNEQVQYNNLRTCYCDQPPSEVELDPCNESCHQSFHI